MAIWAWILCGVAWWGVGLVSGIWLISSGQKQITLGDVPMGCLFGLIGPIATMIAVFVVVEELFGDIVIWPPSKWKGKG